MRFILTYVLWLTLPIICSAQADFVREFDFESKPKYWSWIDEQTTETKKISYANEQLVMEGLGGGNFWPLIFLPIRSDSSFSMSVDYELLKLVENGGFGLLLKSNEDYVFYRVLSQRTYVVNAWNQETKKWRAIKSGTLTGVELDTPTAVKPSKTCNLKVRIEADACSFYVDDVEQTKLYLSQQIGELKSKIDAVGMVVSRQVIVTPHRFKVSAFTHVDRVVPNAFPNVNKQYVGSLNVDKSARHVVIAPNSEQVYFTVSGKSTYDDVMTATATSDSTWGTPELIGPPINNDKPNSVISVSQDGNELFLWGQYTADGLGAGRGFSVSQRTKDGWATPTNITVSDYVNKAKTREECTSTDRKVVILSCERDDTFGDKDLYIAFRSPDGTYSKPVQLGAEINSSKAESNPFLAADNRTLYFSSFEGGFGSSDVYVSKRLDDTWLKWSPRLNMGPNINTNGWDAYFSIHPSGKYAYLNTTDGLTTGIYRVELQRNAVNAQLLPDPVVIVRGAVLNARTRAPISTSINYADLRTGEELGVAHSEPAKGRYSIVLSGGRTYEFFAAAPGFFPVSDNLDIDTLLTYQVIERDLLLEPIDIGAVIRLNNLFFDYNKSELRNESIGELKRLITMLEQYPNMKIEISGHTDDRGSDTYNVTLSKNRAESVRGYLVSNGVASERLKSEGYGKQRPIEKGTSESARQKNRRVEIKIESI